MGELEELPSLASVLPVSPTRKERPRLAYVISQCSQATSKQSPVALAIFSFCLPDCSLSLKHRFRPAHSAIFTCILSIDICPGLSLPTGSVRGPG